MARRAAAVREARGRGETPVLLLESGDFLFGREPRRGEGRAALRARAELILRGYREIGYDAVLPGEVDLSQGLPLLREHQRQGVPFTCLNLVSARSGKPLFPPCRRFSLGATKVLVAGVVGEGVFPRGFVSARGWKVLPPAESLEALAARELPPDGVLVVLSHLGEAGDAALARDLRRPALILGAHSGRPSRGPVRGTGSFVLRPRGRGVGIVEIVAGRAGEGRAAAAGGFADAAALEGYREQRRGLAAQVERMDEERRRIYGNAVLRLDEAIREAEGMRLLEIRDRSLGKEIPDDPGIAAMIAGHVKRFGPLSASR